ncbi:hypothetical protein Q4I28_007193 [Leishmania naiffi]|uniref:D-alanyl-glycyl endopeptidase-like protein n=1 Tax=Leishmania naiffi TaxID=5678 RepID=A0AAW3BAG1_9TRYP
MSTPRQNLPDDMNNDGGGSRSRHRARPNPLAFPRDRAYGTLRDDSDGEGSCSAGVGNSRQSGLLMGGSTHRQPSSDSLPLWSQVTSPIIQIRDHCHQQWLAVLLTIVLLFLTFYFVFCLSAPMRAEWCATPFGSLLGESSGVAAYSNCRNDYGGDRMERFVSVGLQRLSTGFKWKALEYARRYWILKLLLTFPPLPREDYIILTEAANAVNGLRGGRGSSVVPLERYANLFLPSMVLQNSSQDMPAMRLNGEPNNLSASVHLMNRQKALVQPYDIVVYAKNSRTLPSGHVAVVIAVDGPFHSVTAAGNEVHWFIVKNASTLGRQPMAPWSKLPQQLLSQGNGFVNDSVAQPKNATSYDTERYSASSECENASAKENAKMISGCSVLYYKVFIVEQNWDNSYWGTLSYLTGSPPHNSTANESSSRRRRKTAAGMRNYTRVLLLHEYSNPHGFFLEDTHNNVILGWVRASSDR